MVILLSAVNCCYQLSNLISVINYCYCLKMMKNDPFRLYGYSILPLLIEKELGTCTVMQKPVLS